MTQKSKNNDDMTSSQENVVAPLTVGDLLVAITEIMRRTGRDFVLDTTNVQGALSPSGTTMIAADGTGTAGMSNNAASAVSTADDVSPSTTAAASPGPSPGATTAANPAVAADATTTASVAVAAASTDPVAAAAASTDPLVAAAANADSPVAAAAAATATTGPVPVFDGAILNIPTGVDPDDPNVRWYTVTAGTSVGVFAHWPTVAPLVLGMRGACYVRFPTRAEALAAFHEAVIRGAVRIIHAPTALFPTQTFGNPGAGGPGSGPGGAGGSAPGAGANGAIAA